MGGIYLYSPMITVTLFVKDLCDFFRSGFLRSQGYVLLPINTLGSRVTYIEVICTFYPHIIIILHYSRQCLQLMMIFSKNYQTQSHQSLYQAVVNYE